MFGFKNISVRGFFNGKPPVPLVSADKVAKRSAVRDNVESYRKNVRQKAYGYLFIALGAKLAEVDGNPNDKEINSFAEIFGGAGSESKNMEAIVAEALNDGMGFEHYINRIVLFFPNNKNLFKDTVVSLFRLAAADGHINEKEISFLRRVCAGFALPMEVFTECLRECMIPAGGSPYDMLSTGSKASSDEIKKAYYNAISAYHPDRFADVDGDGSIAAIANERMKMLNEAWLIIKRQRKIK